MGKSMRRSPAKRQAKLQRRGDGPKAKVNRRLAEQTRKILGKHYASKYQVR
jgi:hypothetical protein